MFLQAASCLMLHPWKSILILDARLIPLSSPLPSFHFLNIRPALPTSTLARAPRNPKFTVTRGICPFVSSGMMPIPKQQLQQNLTQKTQIKQKRKKTRVAHHICTSGTLNEKSKRIKIPVPIPKGSLTNLGIRAGFMF